MATLQSENPFFQDTTTPESEPEVESDSIEEINKTISNLAPKNEQTEELAKKSTETKPLIEVTTKENALKRKWSVIREKNKIFREKLKGSKVPKYSHKKFHKHKKGCIYEITGKVISVAKRDKDKYRFLTVIIYDLATVIENLGKFEPKIHEKMKTTYTTMKEIRKYSSLVPPSLLIPEIRNSSVVENLSCNKFEEKQRISEGSVVTIMTFDTELSIKPLDHVKIYNMYSRFTPENESTGKKSSTFLTCGGLELVKKKSNNPKYLSIFETTEQLFYDTFSKRIKPEKKNQKDFSLKAVFIGVDPEYSHPIANSSVQPKLLKSLKLSSSTRIKESHDKVGQFNIEHGTLLASPTLTDDFIVQKLDCFIPHQKIMAGLELFKIKSESTKMLIPLLYHHKISVVGFYRNSFRSDEDYITKINSKVPIHINDIEADMFIPNIQSNPFLATLLFDPLRWILDNSVKLSPSLCEIYLRKRLLVEKFGPRITVKPKDVGVMVPFEFNRGYKKSGIKSMDFAESDFSSSTDPNIHSFAPEKGWEYRLMIGSEKFGLRDIIYDIISNSDDETTEELTSETPCHTFDQKINEKKIKKLIQKSGNFSQPKFQEATLALFLVYVGNSTK